MRFIVVAVEERECISTLTREFDSKEEAIEYANKVLIDHLVSHRVENVEKLYAGWNGFEQFDDFSFVNPLSTVFNSAWSNVGGVDFDTYIIPLHD